MEVIHPDTPALSMIICTSSGLVRLLMQSSTEHLKKRKELLAKIEEGREGREGRRSRERGQEGKRKGMQKRSRRRKVRGKRERKDHDTFG